MMCHDPSMLTRRDCSPRCLSLQWRPSRSVAAGVDKLWENYEAYCLAPDREQRAYTLVKVVAEIAPARYPTGFNVAVGKVAERMLNHMRCTLAVYTFAGYLESRMAADCDKALLAPGIVSDYASDFGRLDFRMDEIDTLADDCALIKEVFEQVKT